MKVDVQAEARGPIKPAGTVLKVPDDEARDKVHAGLAEMVDGEPEGEEPGDRHETMVAFMASLEVPEDPTGSEEFTNGGKPECDFIARGTGLSNVTAAERDAAWAEASAAE